VLHATLRRVARVQPVRTALLTGRYPHRTGSIDTLDCRGLDRLVLPEITLADLLKRAGYATDVIPACCISARWFCPILP